MYIFRGYYIGYYMHTCDGTVCMSVYSVCVCVCLFLSVFLWVCVCVCVCAHAHLHGCTCMCVCDTRETIFCCRDKPPD